MRRSTLPINTGSAISVAVQILEQKHCQNVSCTFCPLHIYDCDALQSVITASTMQQLKEYLASFPESIIMEALL